LVRQNDLRRNAVRLASIPRALPSQPTTSGSKSCQGFLSEKQSLLLLSQKGIPVVETSLCESRDQLTTALSSMPAPWVLKICSAAIPHKTEYDLIKVGIHDRERAERAYEELLKRVGELKLPFDGVIVAPLITAQRELIVGARWDPKFGAIVMVGDGGKYVEAMQDAVTMLYPFDAHYAAEQINRLRIAPLFSGVRGEAP